MTEIICHHWRIFPSYKRFIYTSMPQTHEPLKYSEIKPPKQNLTIKTTIIYPISVILILLYSFSINISLNCTQLRPVSIV